MKEEKIERKRERRGKHRGGKVERGGGMGQIIEKYQRDSRFLAPCFVESIDCRWRRATPPPQLVGIGSHGNVEKASHLVLNLDQLSINGCEIIIRDSSFSGARCSPRGKNIDGPFDILLDNEMRVMIYVLDKSVHNLFIIYCHV